MSAPAKKPRGRPRLNKNKVSSDSVVNTVNNNAPSIVPKKRGRRPKGGKIILHTTQVNTTSSSNSQNVIVHLKCNKNDLEATNSTNTNISYYSFDNNSLNDNLLINTTKNSHTTLHTNNSKNNSSNSDHCNNYSNCSKCNSNSTSSEDKNISDKLKSLQSQLKTNNISDSKSACFWCSYDFDNVPIYIPKHILDGTYHVYGCFCSPECATAFLMEENIDSSAKFERYHLLCSIYCKVFGYSQNISPAPNPYYTLDKFYGNLSIKEYRQLFNTNRLLFVIDKPITRDLPELHEDNNITHVPNSFFSA
tara:strand:+ start:212 stop:1129 length:918 start_codon:yes stop_codon:yes gene_type:complete